LTVVVLREKKEQTLLLTPDAKKHSRVERPEDAPECMVVAPAGLFWSPRR
jgi:hypothetical protein